MLVLEYEEVYTAWHLKLEFSPNQDIHSNLCTRKDLKKILF